MQRRYNLAGESMRESCRERALAEVLYYIAIAFFLVFSILCIGGCGKKKKISYGDVPGTATGKIDLSGKDAVIEIDNIKAGVGEDIDYTSKIDVIDNGGAYSVDVNASNVKYDTPGTYHVGYTVKTDNGTYSSNVKVTITGETPENNADEQEGDAPAGEGSANEQQNNVSPVGDQAGDDGAAGQKEEDQGSQGNNGSAGEQPEDNRGGQNGDSQSGQNGNGQNGQSAGGQNNQSEKNNSGQQGGGGGNGGSSQQTKETRELITGKNNTVYKTKNIENAVIELLSGDVVTVSCTTNKYITETRTDVSTVKRGGHTYEVSKLVIVFNTGAERTLETVEKKID